MDSKIFRHLFLVVQIRFRFCKPMDVGVAVRVHDLTVLFPVSVHGTVPRDPKVMESTLAGTADAIL